MEIVRERERGGGGGGGGSEREDINRHDLSEEVRDTYQVIYPDVALTPAAQHTTLDHQVDHSQFDRGYFGQRSWPLPLHKKNVQHTRGGSVTVFIPPSPSLSLGVKINSSASSLNRSESTRRSGTYSVHSVISEHSVCSLVNRQRNSCIQFNPPSSKTCRCLLRTREEQRKWNPQSPNTELQLLDKS